MIKYTKVYINVVSIIITVIIFFVINQIQFFNINSISISKLFKENFVFSNLSADNINKNTKENQKYYKELKIINEKNKKSQNQISENLMTKNLNTANESKKNIDWKISIPVISLEAEISEGTRKEVMDKYVGHFEETATKNGNIGLAAHNRGYPVNYFANIKKLKEGDEIIYKYYNFQRTYQVFQNKIIKDTDWEPLKNTEKNQITLITCVENEPEYRRCIQAVEKVN